MTAWVILPAFSCLFLAKFSWLVHVSACVPVLQDDLLYESLTVYETLYYAAMLRLPQHMDHSAKTERVDTVIAALGLMSCKDTIIGKQPHSPRMELCNACSPQRLGQKHCHNMILTVLAAVLM